MKGSGFRGGPFKEEFLEALLSGSKMMGIPITEEAAGLFFLYAGRLLEENERINLTAIKEAKDVAVKHFLDSLVVVKADVPFSGAWVDVGAGPGFPGMALKLYRQDIPMMLLDASRKRVRFLSEVVSEMELDGVTIEHGRAEDAGRNPHSREYFDRVLARAVARLDVLAELCLPLLRPGGLMIAWKGPGVDEELREAEAAISELGGAETRVWREALPFGMGERRLVVVTKGNPTPKRFPRRAGTPARQPLGGRRADGRG